MVDSADAGGVPTDPAGHDPDGRLVSWRVFLAEASQRLAAAGLDTAEIDARRIVEEASGHDGASLHLALDDPATKRGVAAFDRMLAQRLAGEPLQYVVGRWGFRTLDLFVDRRVLIPRPETEVVAGLALGELARQATGDVLHAVDLGTGSGAIGLSLAAERTDTQVMLTDVSSDALAVARANLAGIGRAATRVSVAEGSWFEALPAHLRQSLAVVVSNPPYVATGDDLPADVADWEPSSALIAGDRGTEDVEHLIALAGEWLRPGGALVLEMAPHQTEAMAGLAVRRGYLDVEVTTDLAGRQRAVVGRWPR